ncbi:MAG: zinc ribbon domain-containing protein [Lachnospiraceae bacterium]|nr:zinc ribbon domain-containing protein [Lachnospiraceae bacterium]
MFCRNCGAEIPEGGSFCGSCGTLVKEETAAIREPEGSRSVMEGKDREKKVDASSGARENNPDMGMQSKGRKPLIIGVCSGALLLAVGTAILFVTGVIGGKDKPKEVIAEAEEPEKAAGSEEQQKEEMEEKPMEEESIEEEPDGEEESVEEQLDEEETEQDVNEKKENTADLAIGDFCFS